MTHDYVLERLDDWAGGELPGAERAEVDLHLAGCAGCRAEADALRALLEEVGALPAEVLPGRDLWAGIAGRLEVRSEASGTRRLPGLPRWALQAAAALTLMVGSSALTYALVGPRQMEQVASDVGRTIMPQRPEITALAAFEPAEQDYQAAIQDLELALQAQRTQLLPETVQTLEVNLAIIDEAIRQSREALGRDPNSSRLARMLGDAYDRKLNVLQQAVSL